MNKGCKQYFYKISEYLDGELDDAVCREIEAHLKDCPQCRECLASLEKTIQLCKEAGKESMPPDIRERLRTNLRDLLKRKLT